MFGLSHASAASLTLACVIAGVLALAVGIAATVAIRRFAKGHHLRMDRRPVWRAPFTLLIVVLAVRGVLLGAATQRPWAGRAAYILGLAAIAIGGWLLTVVVLAIERAMLARHPDAGLADRRSRHARTKIILVTRVAQALIVAITVGAMLWTVPALRDVGAGLLASAGLVGVIVGIAAQTTLGNLFAGLQIAFTDAIRIDDIVVVQGQRGRIEEIALTYVAVRAWDNTTQILPCTYFTTTPFQNWTHKGARISGVVEIGVDGHAPLEEILAALRAELARILEASSLADGEPGTVRVEDAAGPSVRLAAVVTAVDGDAIGPLCSAVREGLVTFLQREYPAAMPGRADAPPKSHTNTSQP
ncbi:MAG TPA: mechanosensitive ion channel domain-containing protein [Streptosporangiaceae bacterium]|nr:mechanosensitive ion channel domain-containing protein [Streptosporangiaceae bacterium]